MLKDLANVTKEFQPGFKTMRATRMQAEMQQQIFRT